MVDDVKGPEWQAGWHAAIWRAVLVCQMAAEDRRHHTFDLGAVCAEEAGHLARRIAALDPHATAAEGDPNAPWMTAAHRLCSEHGIAPGQLDARLAALRDKLEGALPVVPTMRHGLYGERGGARRALVCWHPGDSAAVLDGRFSADELRGLAAHMERHGRAAA